jgi:voltage-gated potassium channel
MILGYGIIAVPTGIVASEINRSKDKDISTQSCPSCSREGHDVDAAFCKYCGEKM